MTYKVDVYYKDRWLDTIEVYADTDEEAETRALQEAAEKTTADMDVDARLLGDPLVAYRYREAQAMKESEA